MHNIYGNFKYKLKDEKFLPLISEIIISMLHYFASADVTLEWLYHMSYLVHRMVLPQKCWILFLRWVGVCFNFHQSFWVFSMNTLEKRLSAWDSAVTLNSKLVCIRHVLFYWLLKLKGSINQTALQVPSCFNILSKIRKHTFLNLAPLRV